MNSSPRGLDGELIQIACENVQLCWISVRDASRGGTMCRSLASEAMKLAACYDRPLRQPPAEILTDGETRTVVRVLDMISEIRAACRNAPSPE